MHSTRRATWMLLAIAAVSVAGHCLVNGRYGFHRDEFPVIDDARHLAWGYVVYPPVTPFIARVALSLFGPSLEGLRLFSALGFGVVIVVSALMARELGAKLWGQGLAAAAVAIAPVPIHNASLFQYVTFDYLAWVLVAYFVLRLCRSDDPRWWLAIGAAIGFGMLSKYTIGVLVAGLILAVFLTARRRDLGSKSLWLGALLSLVVFSPNLLWQMQHHFVSLDWIHHTHLRDVAEGRSEGFLLQQLFVGANFLTLPLWLVGLWFYLFSSQDRSYRMVAWLYLVPLVLLLFMRGRSYYLAPAYPMLLAGGSFWWSEKIGNFQPRARTASVTITIMFLLLGGTEAVRFLMPVARINSALWKRSSKLVDDFAEEIGWPELVGKVAAIYHAQPEGERIAILCGNYGEAGAIDLYGSAYDLPTAISGVNSYWARGYGALPPDTIVLVGFSRRRAQYYFKDPVLAGHVSNSYGVENEEAKEHPDIFVCHQPRMSWPELWQKLRDFG